MACAVGVFTCLGGVVFWGWDVLFGPVKVTTDYAAKINDLVAAHQVQYADQANAWPELVKVLSTSQATFDAVRAARIDTDANELPDPLVLRSVTSTPSSKRPYPEKVAAAQRVMDDLTAQEVFKNLDALATRKHVARTLASNGGVLKLSVFPEYFSARNLARANAMRFHKAVERSDFDGVVKSFESGLALGRCFTHQGLVLERVSGQAIVSLHSEALHQVVGEIQDERVLRDMLAAVDRQSTFPKLSLAIESERLSMLDRIQHVFSDLGDGHGYLLPQRYFVSGSVQLKDLSTKMWLVGISTAGRRQTAEALNVYCDKVIAHVKMPRPDAIRSGFQPDAEKERLPREIVLVQALTSFDTAIFSDDMLKLEFAGLRAALAVEIWRRGHGGVPPATLDDLVPGILSEVPVDVFTGKPLGYKVLAPGSDAAGRRYLLYSFGADGVDDGGVEMPDDPGESVNRYKAVGRTPGPRGYDFVINHGEGPVKSGN